jgi:hypothetical protein
LHDHVDEKAGGERANEQAESEEDLLERLEIMDCLKQRLHGVHGRDSVPGEESLVRKGGVRLSTGAPPLSYRPSVYIGLPQSDGYSGLILQGGPFMLHCKIQS